MTTKYVKQADTWHVVDPNGVPDLRERRPHLRAMCGRKTHTGTYDDTKLDASPIVCGSPEHRKECAAAAEALAEARKQPNLSAQIVESIDQQIEQLGKFCT